MRLVAVAATVIVLTGAIYSTCTFAQAKSPAKSLTQRIEELEARIYVLEFKTNRLRHIFANVDCESKRFGSVESDDPTRMLVLVSCENLEPYLEGYRITLQVGNPYQAQLSVVRGSLYYGSAFPKKKVEIPLPQGLSAGQWTTATVSIREAKASEMKDFQADFYIEQLSLNRRP